MLKKISGMIFNSNFVSNDEIEEYISDIEFFLEKESGKRYLRLHPAAEAKDHPIWNVSETKKIVLDRLTLDLLGKNGINATIITINEYGNVNNINIRPFLIQNHLFENNMVHNVDAIQKLGMNIREVHLFALSLKLFHMNPYSYVKYVENFSPKKFLSLGRYLPESPYLQIFDLEKDNLQNMKFKYKSMCEGDDKPEDIILELLYDLKEQIDEGGSFKDSYEIIMEVLSERKESGLDKEIYKFLESDMNYEIYYKRVFAPKNKSGRS